MGQRPLPHLSRFMKSEGASGSPVDWTVSDVVSYFTAAGFPEQAAAFMTQVSL